MTRSWRRTATHHQRSWWRWLWSRWLGGVARAVELAQQGRSSRVALGSRPLRSGSGSEWRSRLVP